MQKALADLLACNQLEEIDINLYTGRAAHNSGGRIYGGQVLAQALSAAGRTVPQEFTLHSMHAYFLRMGDPDRQVVYEVEAIRDGRSFMTRRVVAQQYGRAIFSAMLSYQVEEDGFEHARTMPDVPPPEALISDDQRLKKYFPNRTGLWPIEFRKVNPPDLDNLQPSEAVSYNWFRATDNVGEDLATHQQLLAYASDNPILITALNPHGVSFLNPDMATISLDHALWFYKPFRVDDWLLYETHSDVAANGRAWCRGRIYNRKGELVAAATQEGLLRLKNR
ncbi:acyl-CoA thioesterase-2 [Litorivivens lipolytica]|uniref:Acyl-CoA thioesterase 2 n=1 Tax=Litorivivens lipolytica TaxID=1524264 RepID=A0A7W4Z6Z5_9GAMM|nr:acyl-CoA thioesterase-2 [Litorivivens lipolytica]